MSIEISYLISLIFGVSGFIGVWYGLSRNKKHDLEKDASENAGVVYELKALQTSLSDFKAEIRMSIETNGRMTLENHDKLIKLEQEMKTVFVRIDELREVLK